MKINLQLFLACLLLLTAGFNAWADQPTALELVKRGDQYIGIQSKDKVVQIRSEKSIASLTPNIWYVVYYDPDATFDAVQVEFGAGEEMEVTHPWRILELTSDDHTVLDSSRIRVDSDQAIRIATSLPLLQNLKLTSTQLWLEHGDNGPQWRVKLWAAELKNPSDEADIGLVLLSAADGSIIKIDLHPDSVE